MKFWSILCLLFSCSNAYNVVWTLDSVQGLEAEIQLDPYYTAADLVFSLDQKPVPRVKLGPEQGVYGYMLRHFFEARQGVLEASVNPLPCLGAWIRAENPKFYRSANFGSNQNIVRSLTSGFPEPWALTGLLGTVVRFVDERDSLIGSGYGGLAMSWGATHLAYGRWVQMQWLEVEAKIKGEATSGNQNLAWSFGLASKEHEDPRVIDLLRLTLKRSRVDREAVPGWSWTRNSAWELRGHLDREKTLKFWHYWFLTALKYEAIYGKKWPTSKGVFALDLGVQWEVATGYRGELAEIQDAGWGLLIRPNWSF